MPKQASGQPGTFSKSERGSGDSESVPPIPQKKATVNPVGLDGAGIKKQRTRQSVARTDQHRAAARRDREALWRDGRAQPSMLDVKESPTNAAEGAVWARAQGSARSRKCNLEA